MVSSLIAPQVFPPGRRPRGARARAAVAALGSAVAILAFSPSGADAQEGCEFGEGTEQANSLMIPGVGRVTYIRRPHFVCEGGDVQIWADSAVAYQERAMSEFIGSVRYLDGSRELLANDARYFTDLGRLQAEGDVTLRDDEAGSSINNGDLVLLLVNDIRDEESMTVTTGADGLRPTAVLAPPPDSIDPEAEPGPPYTVVGDRIVVSGGSSFTAVGDVEIVRDALLAFGDSVEYDQAGGGLLLEGSARVQGDGYDLEGRSITMDSPGSAESALRALRDARLTGDDLLLTAAQILVFMKDDALERLVAIPIIDSNAAADVEADSADTVRPEATVGDFVLTADSLEVSAPDETIERVFAAGHARSVSASRDTLNVELLPEIARTDWLEGDTVIVTFLPPEESVDEGGEAGGRDVDEIVARGSARSLYRLEPSDTTARIGTDPPAVHYVVGEEIRIEMGDGEVQGMRVTGQTRGVHLEPLRRAAPADADTLQPDTATALRPDTATILRPDTAVAVGPDSTYATGRYTEPYDRVRRSVPADEHSPRDTGPTGADDAPWEEEPWTVR